MDKLFDLVVTSLWAPATYAKFLFLAVTAPFWWPLAKVMYNEMVPALKAGEGAPRTRRPAGEDPFLNIPLASHRSRLRAARAPSVPAPGRTRR